MLNTESIHNANNPFNGNQNRAALENLSQPVCVLESQQGELLLTNMDHHQLHNYNQDYVLKAWVSPLQPEKLGAETFLKLHGVRFPYIAGEMAGGIASEEMVIAMSRAGMLAFFGSGGLALSRVEKAIKTIQQSLNGAHNYGFNLLHNPFENDAELELIKLYLRYGIRRISASAFTHLTLPLVYYRVKGIHRDSNGMVQCPNHIFAKLSRTEVAQQFMEPPPMKLLEKLVEEGYLTIQEAEISQYIPMAEDITIEGDSGGHTDRRSTIPLLSTVCELRDRIVRQQNYKRNIRVGAAGGISTPASVAAAFIAGADYVLTGSINQSCVEADTSEAVKKMLCNLDVAGVDMAPAADMFEMGVQVQVAKSGSLFPARARKLYEIYRQYESLDDIPDDVRRQFEKQLFRKSLTEAWEETRDYLRQHNPTQLKKAEANPKHKMAMLFRWYLGMSSRWAKQGLSVRSVDFQVWCGPAMGSFNQWVKGSFLESYEQRHVELIAMNLLYGAAYLIRTKMLSIQGVALPPELIQVKPRLSDRPHQLGGNHNVEY